MYPTTEEVLVGVGVIAAMFLGTHILVCVMFLAGETEYEEAKKAFWRLTDRQAYKKLKQEIYERVYSNKTVCTEEEKGYFARLFEALFFLRVSKTEDEYVEYYLARRTDEYLVQRIEDIEEEREELIEQRIREDKLAEIHKEKMRSIAESVQR